MNDKLIIALRTTIMGMGIVIFALYILSIILDFMKYLFHSDKKDTKTISKQSSYAEKPTNQNNTNKNIEDEQIVAVISAALSAYLERPANQIKICTIQKIHKQTPVWGMVSRLKDRL